MIKTKTNLHIISIRIPILSKYIYTTLQAYSKNNIYIWSKVFFLLYTMKYLTSHRECIYMHAYKLKIFEETLSVSVGRYISFLHAALKWPWVGFFFLFDNLHTQIHRLKFYHINNMCVKTYLLIQVRDKKQSWSYKVRTNRK